MALCQLSALLIFYIVSLYHVESQTVPQPQCQSAIGVDIIIALDASGSVGAASWSILKDFLRTSIVPSINLEYSQIGFIVFSDYANFSHDVSVWQSQQLENYVDGLFWKRGYTDTQAMIQLALNEFTGVRTSSYVPHPDRDQILLIFTDGNPCMPSGRGCPYSVCYQEPDIYSAGIRAVVVAIGDGINQQWMSCITEGDWYELGSFASSDLESIMGGLYTIICPVTDAPTMEPSASSSAPTSAPTSITNNPTLASLAPTSNPAVSTKNPSHPPSTSPTKNPTATPSATPTKDPTQPPSNDPSQSPIENPTESPTNDPTIEPTNDPSKSPTNAPTISSTQNPSASPSLAPSEGDVLENSANYAFMHFFSLLIYFFFLFANIL